MTPQFSYQWNRFSILVLDQKVTALTLANFRFDHSTMTLLPTQEAEYEFCVMEKIA